MTIRIYSSLDSGAPALPNLAAQRPIDNLKIILKACLVDGYSGKPAAGWTIGHEHADGISFGNGEGFINFVNIGSSQMLATYLLESITDGSAALATGANRRSGQWFEGQSTVSRQYVPFLPQGTHAGNGLNKGWIVVADDKTATVLSQQGSDAVWTGPDTSNGAYGAAFHFGQFYPSVGGVGFICLGGGTNTSVSSAGLFGGSALCGTALRNPFTGLIDQGTTPAYEVFGRGQPQATSANTVFLRSMPRVVQFSRAGGGMTGPYAGSLVMNFLTYCGALRGLLFDPFLNAQKLAVLFPVLGVPTPTKEDRLRVLSVSGKEIIPLLPNINDLGGFISLDPADWDPLWT